MTIFLKNYLKSVVLTLFNLVKLDQIATLKEIHSKVAPLLSLRSFW